ncbi:MAG TPA: phosphate ABC transporter substrate-binding protein PstS [Lacipirellulaceae bacterium]|nr:phosphate ABC transporter substrate-binding protein PstS [Lacipirellulaceae bacterium]
MRRLLAAVLLASAVGALGCGTAGETRVRLQGAGATFPAPFYKRLVAVYEELHPAVMIDYQSIGSGGGIRAITDKTVQFAASDAPMSEAELEGVGGADAIIEIPTCAGGVVPTYNLPGVASPLKFTGELIADIYLGKVSQWNDPAIAELNPDLELPRGAITPVWRTDGSGTTYIVTNYLATQSKDFEATVGTGKQVQWPVGQGGKGNEGVTAVVQQTVGAFGYVEQSYADHNKLPYGMVKNQDGNFVKAAPDTVSLAGAGAVSKMEGQILAADIWNQPGQDAYPIASFTYLIVYKDLNNLPNKEAAQALVDFLWWATHDGQQYAAELDYAPLAPEVQAKVEQALKVISYKGQSLRIANESR